jgi:peptide/nickel transport system substrate-binding protein
MMGRRKIATTTTALAAVVALAVIAIVAVAPAGAQDDSSNGGKHTLKIGWAQNPHTLNPFVGLDEESFTVWALNWDLLVNFSPKDLTPAPGIAESWDVSDDEKTVTFHLVQNATWSDGVPITSKDVKYSLEVLGGEGALFTSYTDNITSITTPDDHTVVIKTSKPDARIVGGLFIYTLPQHIWGKVPVSELTGSYQPQLPLVGSGPFIVTQFDPGKLLTMERNPDFRGPAPEFDKIQFVTYGNEDAVERALQLGEVDLVAEVQPTTFDRVGEQPDIETLRSPSPSFTELAFNLCSEKNCPDAEFNPAVQDRTVRQAIAYAVDRERINTISSRDTSFVAHGLLPEFYKSFYEVPEQDYPLDVDRANQMLDDAGWESHGDGPRTKGDETLSFDVYVRSESRADTQAAQLIAEEAKAIGVEFKVQVVSTDKLTELTVRKVDGKPAPDFDTFVWGWGGDPYDPSFLLGLVTTGEIGNSSDSFYSNPEYDKLFEQQSTVFDTARRKEIIQRMVAITQRDLPYLVLTYDPVLQAYRTDRVGNVTPVCPEGDDGGIFCDQISYEPVLTLTPGVTSSDDSGGGGGVVLVIVGVLVIAAIAFFGIRARRRGGGGGGRDGGALELED